MKTAAEFINGLKKTIKAVRYEIEVNSDSTDKLYYQKRQERDFAKVTDEMNKEVLKAFIKEFTSEKHDLVADPNKAFTAALEAGGKKYRNWILKRFGDGKKDIALRPLTIQYIKQKGNAKIGINTGKLRRDIRTAPLKIQMIQNKK